MIEEEKGRAIFRERRENREKVGGTNTGQGELVPSLSSSFCNLFMNAFCHRAQWKYKC